MLFKLIFTEHCSKSFACIHSFIPHSNTWRWVPLLSSLQRGENWGKGVMHLMQNHPDPVGYSEPGVQIGSLVAESKLSVTLLHCLLWVITACLFWVWMNYFIFNFLPKWKFASFCDQNQPCYIESSADSMKMARKTDIRNRLKKKWIHVLGWLIASVGEEVETLELWCIADGNVKCHCHHGKQFGNSSKS